MRRTGLPFAAPRHARNATPRWQRPRASIRRAQAATRRIRRKSRDLCARAAMRSRCPGPGPGHRPPTRIARVAMLVTLRASPRHAPSAMRTLRPRLSRKATGAWDATTRTVRHRRSRPFAPVATLHRRRPSRGRPRPTRSASRVTSRTRQSARAVPTATRTVPRAGTRLPGMKSVASVTARTTFKCQGGRSASRATRTRPITSPMPPSAFPAMRSADLGSVLNPDTTDGVCGRSRIAGSRYCRNIRRRDARTRVRSRFGMAGT
jgi:hypothetical protein